MKKTIFTGALLLVCLLWSGAASAGPIGDRMKMLMFFDGRNQQIPLENAVSDSSIPPQSPTPYSLAAKAAFADGEWQSMTVTFVPRKSGHMLIVPHADGAPLDFEGKLKRNADGSLPDDAWFYCDDITAEGAETVLLNSGFEASPDSIAPWKQFGRSEEVKSLLTEDAYGVHSGKRALKLSAGAPVGQGLRVKENVPVTVRVWFRKPAPSGSK